MVGVTSSTVFRDMLALDAEWRAEAQEERANVRARELAELRELEARCEIEYASEGLSPGDRRALITERRQIKARIAAMMGLDEPTKLHHEGELSIKGGLNAEERAALVQEMAQMFAPAAAPTTTAAKAPRARKRKSDVSG